MLPSTLPKRRNKNSRAVREAPQHSGRDAWGLGKKAGGGKPPWGRPPPAQKTANTFASRKTLDRSPRWHEAQGRLAKSWFIRPSGQHELPIPKEVQKPAEVRAHLPRCERISGRGHKRGIVRTTVLHHEIASPSGWRGGPWRELKMAHKFSEREDQLIGVERGIREFQTIRASSLGELFDCPARWEAKHVRGLRLPSSSASQLGTAVHAGTAVFDQSRIDGAGLSADDAAGAVVDTIWHPQTDVDWAELSQREAEPIALALHKKYCGEISPRLDFAAVEATCERLDIADLGISLTGTTDRVFIDSLTGEYGIADIKTGKTVVSTDGSVKTAGHAAQIAVYELLAETATGQPMSADAKIIGLQTAKTEAGRRAGIGTIHDARTLLVGDEETPGLLQLASKFIKTGTFYGNPRSSLCSKKYCPAYDTCRFRR